MTLSLRDPSRSPSDLGIHPGALRAKDTHVELQSATPTAKMLPADAGILPVVIDMADLHAAGSFELPVQLWEPGQPIQRFVVGMSAGDEVWAPLLTILFGVAVSFGLRHLAERYEPRQRLLARVEDLREDVRRFLGLSSDIGRRLELTRLERRLSSVQVKSETDDLKALGQELDGIKAEVDAFHLGWNTRAVALAESLKAAGEATRAERRSFHPPPTGDEEAALDEFADELVDVEERLSREELDLVETELDSWKDDFRGVRLNRQRRLLGILDAEMPARDSDEFEEAAALRADAASACDGTDPDVAAAALLKLSNFLSRHQEVVPQALRETVGDATPPPAEAESVVPVPTFRRSRSRQALLRASRARLALAVFAMILAVVSGLAALYFGKPFGTGTDYLMAAFWGFGSDSAVQNVDALVKRLRGAAA